MTSAGTDQARQLAGMFTELDRHRRALSQRATLGTADMRLLWLLSDGHPRSLKQIAEQLGLEQSTANRQVNAALTAGLINRDRLASSSPYLFASTAHGSREFDRNLTASLDTYRGALDALGPGSDRLLPLLRGFLDALEDSLDDGRSAPGAPVPPLPS